MTIAGHNDSLQPIVLISSKQTTEFILTNLKCGCFVNVSQFDCFSHFYPLKLFQSIGGCIT